MSDAEWTGSYPDAIRDGFQFAHELGRRCGPVDLLVGIAAGRGSAARALDPGQGRYLREVVGASDPGDAAGYLRMQAQEAARSLARSRDEQPGAEHLLIALIDQGTPAVTNALTAAALEPALVRRAAITAIGAPADLPPIPLPALPPAGAMDRPPLPADELDSRAWEILRWRQDRLPLGRLRMRSGPETLLRLEREAAAHLAERLRLDDDQRYSLISHHSRLVAQRVDQDRPDLGTARQRGQSAQRERAQRHMRAMKRRQRHPVLRITTGWGTWFGNRWASISDHWFRLRTMRTYRGAPQP
jgi:hypothetical protein